MVTFGQWLHEHSLLLVCLAVLALAAVGLRLLRVRRTWWAVWLIGAVLIGLVLARLRTPPASVSQYGLADAPGTADGTPPVLDRATAALDPKSVEEVRAAIAGDRDRPTLVEVYSDYGLD